MSVSFKEVRLERVKREQLLVFDVVKVKDSLMIIKVKEIVFFSGSGREL